MLRVWEEEKVSSEVSMVVVANGGLANKIRRNLIELWVDSSSPVQLEKFEILSRFGRFTPNYCVNFFRSNLDLLL